MPIRVDDFMALAEVEQSAPSRNGKGPSQPSKWDMLFQPHPEAGGPFGGRDTALTALVGMFRTKRIPYDSALALAQMWDRQYCDPPLGFKTISEKISRGWVEWKDGPEADLTPEEARGEPAPWNFLTAEDLLTLDLSGGGVTWLVDKAIAENRLNMVTAPPGGAKSWLMLDLARRFAIGQPWFNGMGVKQCAVLYVDEEMGASSVSTRIRKLGVPANAPLYYLGREGVKLSRMADVRRLLAFAQEHDVRMMFFDTLVRFHDYDESDNSQMSRMLKHFQPLLDNGITVFIGHHDRKRGGDTSVSHERSRGASDIQGQMDMTFGIDKIGKAFHLSVTKPRHLSDEEAEALRIDFVIEDTPDGQTRVREITSEEKAEAVKKGVRTQIVDALMDGPLDTSGLLAAVKGRKDVVLDAAKALVEEGDIWRAREGKRLVYSLPGSDVGPED